MFFRKNTFEWNFIKKSNFVPVMAWYWNCTKPLPNPIMAKISVAIMEWLWTQRNKWSVNKILADCFPHCWLTLWVWCSLASKKLTLSFNVTISRYWDQMITFCAHNWATSDVACCSKSSSFSWSCNKRWTYCSYVNQLVWQYSAVLLWQRQVFSKIFTKDQGLTISSKILLPMKQPDHWIIVALP